MYRNLRFDLKFSIFTKQTLNLKMSQQEKKFDPNKQKRKSFGYFTFSHIDELRFH